MSPEPNVAESMPYILSDSLLVEDDTNSNKNIQLYEDLGLSDEGKRNNLFDHGN